METILGKRSQNLDEAALARLASGYGQVLVDLGAGDGRFVLHAARSDPGLLAIGLDAARENLREASRSAPNNALFVIANALNLPDELNGLAGRLVINFPWGSLLEGLLASDPGLMDGLYSLARPGALLEVRLNASALSKTGCALDEGAEGVCAGLEQAGFGVRLPRLLNAAALRLLPSTWARRMAFGRRPEAVYIQAQRVNGPISLSQNV